MGLSPTSPRHREYSSFLKAQEESPTLVLAHAKIGDSGAQEVAEFGVRSAHLRLLDLTGCEISSTGLMHLAEVVRRSLTVESLVLRHNALTSGPLKEEALKALCAAAAASPSLRHLDLRHCGIGGEAACHVASILQGNQGLSHLELSWNLLGPSGGQLLLESIRKTSGLYDCQLTGCRLAEETLTSIAELLLRNRKAHRADLKAGPYQGTWLKHAAEQDFEGQAPVSPALRSQGGEAVANRLRYAVANIPGNAVACAEKTSELVERLLELRHRFLPESFGEGKVAQVQEFLGYLERGQADTSENQQAAHTVQRTKLIEGFEQRELRYRQQIALWREELLEHAKDHGQLQGNLRRSSEELKLAREELELAKEELKRFQRHCEEDELRDQSTLASITSDRKELERKLAQLQDRGHHLETETALLRRRALQVRERIANEVT